MFRTLPNCLAGEGGTPLEEARALAPPAYCPPLAGHLWSVDLCDDKFDVSMMRHPIARRSAQHVYIKWHERTFSVDRDELERTGYVEPKIGFPSHKTLYAARELAEALIDSEALAQWRRQGLEEDLQERERSSFDIAGYYIAKKETPEQQEERLRRAEEYINGPRIFSA